MTDHVIQTIRSDSRSVRKVWRIDEETGESHDAYQYQKGKEWIDYQPTVQEALEFVAAKLAKQNDFTG